MVGSVINKEMAFVIEPSGGFVLLKSYSAMVDMVQGFIFWRVRQINSDCITVEFSSNCTPKKQCS